MSETDNIGKRLADQIRQQEEGLAEARASYFGEQPADPKGKQKEGLDQGQEHYFGERI